MVERWQLKSGASLHGFDSGNYHLQLPSDAQNFPTKCFPTTNLNCTSFIVNICRKTSYIGVQNVALVQEYLLHILYNSGVSCQVRETLFLHFNLQIQVHLASDFISYFFWNMFCSLLSISLCNIKCVFM